MKRIRLLAEAEDEYGRAVKRYEEELSGLGLDLIGEVDHALERIRREPQRYALVSEGVRSFALRRFPYSVVYSEQDDCIWVVAIAHHKRRPEYWRRRKLR